MGMIVVARLFDEFWDYEEEEKQLNELIDLYEKQIMEALNGIQVEIAKITAYQCGEDPI